ncbi:hypothetical protein PPNSA23_15470 [Phyllobacterium phragmitis]|uniref:Uncharacterized protein n=1 Tax=Phyllobacterium phragmitis TaxID=2670329 RepID=A0ABQ0GY67_9HYPH
MLAQSISISYRSFVSGFKDVTVKGVVTVFAGQAGWVVTVPSARLGFGRDTLPEILPIYVN